MARKVELGQRSIVGEIPNNGLDEMFGDAEYPVKVMVTNHMPREISLPELNLFLGQGATLDGSNKQVTSLSGLDQLRRVSSSIEQISMLNAYEFAAITIEEVGVPEDPDGSNGGQGDDASGDESKGDGDAGNTNDSGDAPKDGSPNDGAGSDTNKTPEATHCKTTGASKKHKGD